MRNLYARIVLWLIRPALDAHRRFDEKAIAVIVRNEVVKDARNGGPITRVFRQAQGGSSRPPQSDAR